MGKKLHLSIVVFIFTVFLFNSLFLSKAYAKDYFAYSDNEGDFYVLSETCVSWRGGESKADVKIVHADGSYELHEFSFIGDTGHIWCTRDKKSQGAIERKAKYMAIYKQILRHYDEAPENELNYIMKRLNGIWYPVDDYRQFVIERDNLNGSKIISAYHLKGALAMKGSCWFVVDTKDGDKDWFIEWDFTSPKSSYIIVNKMNTMTR